MALNYRFRPSIISLIVISIVLLILVRLGMWQLSRAEEKREILQKTTNIVHYIGSIAPPALMSLDAKMVKAELKLINNEVWLLDNQVYEGKVGYGVVAAAEISDATTGLVHLGWIPANSDRNMLPEIELPTQLEVTGRLKTKDFDAFSLAKVDSLGYGNRVQSINQIIYQANDIITHPLLIYANSNTVNNWPQTYKVVVMKPEKHEAYAIQWFLLALASLVVFVIASTNKESHIETE